MIGKLRTAKSFPKNKNNKKSCWGYPRTFFLKRCFGPTLFLFFWCVSPLDRFVVLQSPGCWRLAAAGGLLTAGCWRLAGGWRSERGCWQLAAGWLLAGRPPAAGCWPAAGGWLLAAGRLLAAGGWRPAAGGGWLAAGCWRLCLLPAADSWLP